MLSPISLPILKSKQDHKNNKHPDFQFKCRFPGCQFKSWSMRSRQTHWDDKHGKRSTPLPCEICGKTYIDLKKHMEYHLKPNEMTCDLCGKSFPSKARFDFHYKPGFHGPPDQRTDRSELIRDFQNFHRFWSVDPCYKQTHDKTYPCPQCGQLFNRMQNVVNHQGIVRFLLFRYSLFLARLLQLRACAL